MEKHWAVSRFVYTRGRFSSASHRQNISRKDASKACWRTKVDSDVVLQPTVETKISKIQQMMSVSHSLLTFVRKQRHFRKAKKQMSS